MNLEGSLDAFGLPDVVTLLASTGKSGALGVHRTGAAGRVEGVLWFRDGRLTGASSDRARASLVRRLVGSGAVDDAALRAAVARVTADGLGLARALLDAGSVDPELLAQAATDQALDAVFDVLRWPDGDFGFDQSATDVDDVGLSLDPAAVLDEARARVAAWGRLEALVPGEDCVLSLPVVLHDDPVVTRDEWALLALVDGRRRVRDLVELTGCGQFAVMSTLARLVERGLVHVHDQATPDHVGVVERRLGLLASVEETTEETVVPAAPTRAPEVPAGPGSLGLTAAAALAAARAAQGQPQTQSAPGRSSRPGGEPVPARPEPFLPERRPEHPEPAYASASAPHRGTAYAATSVGGAPATVATSVVEGATARTLAEPVVQSSPEGVIERDPSVNRSLLLRLIAGVRGL